MLIKYTNKGGKFLKKLWCRVGGSITHLLRRRANARNVSFRISLRWTIHIINPVDKTKLSVKIHVWFKIANITHALLVPVYRQTDFSPKWVVVSRLKETVARFRTGVKFSPRCENRGDPTPG